MANEKASQSTTEPTSQLAPEEIAQDSVTPVFEEKRLKNWPIVVFLILFFIALVLIGSLVYQNYNLKQQISLIQSPVPAIHTPKPSEASIKWLTYQNEKYDFLKFRYPEGAVIKMSSDPNPEICEMEGCFSLEMTYEDLKLYIEHLTGIGGIAVVSDIPYAIITGNHYEGIGKIIEEDSANNEISIRYFEFKWGGQQFGHFLGEAQSFTFTMPKGLQSEYEPITDIIACSVLDLEPDEKGLYSKAYLDREANSVVGVNEDKTIFMILSGDDTINEKINNFSINPTAQFLSISTVIGNGPEFFRLFYNLNSRKFIEIEGKQKHSSYGGPPEVWADDFEYLDADSSGYYIYNVKVVTKTTITKEEYENLMKST